jgi:hypothetical protein
MGNRKERHNKVSVHRLELFNTQQRISNNKRDKNDEIQVTKKYNQQKIKQRNIEACNWDTYKERITQQAFHYTPQGRRDGNMHSFKSSQDLLA